MTTMQTAAPVRPVRRSRRLTRGQAVGWTFSLLLIAVLVYPVGTMVWRALAPQGTLDLEGVAGTFTGYGLWNATLNTVLVAVPAALIATLIGATFAWLNERTDAAFGPLGRLLPILSMLFPTFALAFGWLVVGDRTSGFLLGVLRLIVSPFGIEVAALPIGIASFAGLIFLYSITLAPFVYVQCQAAFRQLDPSLEEMSRIAGRGRLSTFFTVSLPSIRPAVTMSLFVTLLLGVGMYSIPAVIGTPGRITVLSVYIANLINGQYPPLIQEATVIGLCLMILILAVWLMLRASLNQGRYASVGGRGIRPNRIAMGRWRGVLRAAMWLYIVFAVLLPLVGLVVVSFEKYWTPDLVQGGFSWENLLAFTKVRGGGIALIGNTLWISVVSATVIVIVAGLVAIGSTGRSPRLYAVVASVATKVPFAIPTIVIAVGVLATFGFPPFNLSGTYWILLIAYFFSIPIASIAAEAAARQVGPELVEAARVSGASPLRSILRVNLPLMLSGLAGAWVITFAHVMGDLNMIPILSSATNRVAGTALIDILGGGGSIIAAAQISLIIGLVTLAVVVVVTAIAQPRFTGRGRRSRDAAAS